MPEDQNTASGCKLNCRRNQPRKIGNLPSSELDYPGRARGQDNSRPLLSTDKKDELTPDVVSTPSGIMEAQTDKLTMGAQGVVESFQGLRVFALR